MRNIEDIYPLSPMQEGILFHSLYAPEAPVYVEQISCTFEGEFDDRAFEQAWRQSVKRHPILRTSFVREGLDEPVQVVHRQVELPFSRLDWRELEAGEARERVQALLTSEREAGFDLAEAPLMRLVLARRGKCSWFFVWSHHHILMDGWSVSRLFGDVIRCYAAIRSGREYRGEPVRPYRDYIAWLRQQDMARAEAYWKRALAGFNSPTRLPAACSDASGRGGDWIRELVLGEEFSVRLATVAQENGITLNSVLQGAWALVLSRYATERDVVYGTTVSGRPAELDGAEAMIGLFINTLPVRARIDPAAPVASWLKTLHAGLAEARQYEYTPLVRIQSWSELPRGTPLFESILVFENYPIDAAVRDLVPGISVSGVRHFGKTNYPLTLVASPAKTLGIQIAFDPVRFDAATVDRILGHWRTTLESIAADPHQQAAAVALLAADEYRCIVDEWNDTTSPYPSDKCIHQLFEEQAARAPDAPALLFEDRQWSYRQLNEASNRLAHYLRARGAGPESPIGIYLDRSPEMIIAALAVLKASSAYLPLDPSSPDERTAYLLADSGVGLVITSSALRDGLRFEPAGILCVDALGVDLERQPSDNPLCAASPDNLAYVIYTSGSTGQPKGVLLQHRGLCNFAGAIAQATGLVSGARQLQFASFSFDASVAEIFPALASGAAVVMARQETLLSIPDLLELLREKRVAAAHFPPSLLKILPPHDLPELRTVMSVGEACTHEIAARWSAGRTLFNGYGPTEITIGASWTRVDGANGGDSPPVGRAIRNMQVYLVDPALRPVPVGIPGEICVGGIGLARGYLNLPGLTAEKFVPNPFSHEPGSRLYKTGDLARYRADGQIEYLGRIDRQVKVRGFRVELGEIEAVLESHPGIGQAAADVREDERGERRVVVWATPRGATVPLPAEILGFLKAKLPAFMLPSAIVTLSGLPLLPSGKVNRKALPAPDAGSFTAPSAYSAPRSPVEEILAELFAGVLGQERAGIDSHFFELGGHSLLAAQLMSRVEETLGVRVPLRALFDNPTVAGLAAAVAAALPEAGGTVPPPMERIPRDGELPLSYAQQRLWFLDQLEPASPLYNNPVAVRLTGCLDVDVLEQSLNQIVRRHEVLRTSFAGVEGRPVSVISERVHLPVAATDLRFLPAEEREKELRCQVEEESRRPFSLVESPLVRVRLWRVADDEHVALLVLHHIVADGWSIGVLVRELGHLYAAYAAGREQALPQLQCQYVDFAHWQRRWLSGEVLDRQLNYWREKLAGAPPILELPTDRPRPAVQSSRGKHQQFLYPGELLAGLKRLCREEGVTLFMTLMAAWQVLLSRWSGQEDVCAGTPVANRTRTETEPLIGFFVNTLVIRTSLRGNPAFRELLQRVKESALGAYANQDLPFEMLVDSLQIRRDLSHAPLFQAMLVLNNVPVSALDLPGVRIEPVMAESVTARFDLTLELAEQPQGLAGSLEYNADLFDEATAVRMTQQFRRLLEGVVAGPGNRLSELPLLDESEHRLVVEEWNDTKTGYPAGRCFHELFEERAARHPDSPAILFGGRSVSYGELNRQANRLAACLQKLGVGPDVLAGVSFERCPELVVSVLAVLKAGGAFLPIDPSYPPERLAYMVADSGVGILLSQQAVAPRLPETATRLVCVDAEAGAIAAESPKPCESPVTSRNLAYMIYTSGSTGRPKGTLLEHAGLCNLAQEQKRAFHISEASRVLQFAPLSFDASVWEICMALANGGAIVMAPQEQLSSMEELRRVLSEQLVTTVTLPPAVLGLLSPEGLPQLRTVIAAGEACPSELVGRWSAAREFFNAYGPTETTVCATMELCDPRESGNPPIGRPIANARVYLLDRHLNPTPLGVPGELCVGGVLVARGYRNRPDLTAERFVPDPFGGVAGARLYRTGDLARFRPDGRLEYLGRVDEQVKVRGYRIETGEIEAILREHPAVAEAAVVARDDGSGAKQLVAYWVDGPGQAATSSDLRAFLRGKVPEYMVPSLLVKLESMPLTPSGKIDRKALPAPDASQRRGGQVYVAPRTATERVLAQLCGDLLGVAQVGVQDNFFDLGGHSLLATQLISRIRRQFEIELPLRTLFERPTVEGLALAIDQALAVQPAAVPALQRVSREARRVKRAELDAATERAPVIARPGGSD